MFATLRRGALVGSVALCAACWQLGPQGDTDDTVTSDTDDTDVEPGAPIEVPFALVEAQGWGISSMAAVDGRLLTRTAVGLSASDDAGRTWRRIGDDVGALHAGEGLVAGLASDTLSVSTDQGDTFTARALPADGGPWSGLRVAVGGAGRLWVSARDAGEATALFTSANAGVSWTAVPLVDVPTFGWSLRAGTGDDLAVFGYLDDDAGGMIAWWWSETSGLPDEPADWVDLGAYDVVHDIAPRGAAALVSATLDGAAWEGRFTDGGATVTEGDVDLGFGPALVRYHRTPDALFRTHLSGASRVERSDDDGLTWTALSLSSHDDVAGFTTVPAPADAAERVWFGVAGGSPFRWEPGDTTWRRSTLLTLGGKYRDIAFSGDRVVVLEHLTVGTRVHISEDGGARWRDGPVVSGAVACVTLEPGGDRAFLGKRARRYHLGAPDAFVGDGATATPDGASSEWNIQQCAWRQLSSTQAIEVTLSTDDEDDGGMMRYGPFAPGTPGSWSLDARTLIGEPSDSRFWLRSFHGLGVSGDQDATLVGVREYAGGAGQSALYMTHQFGGDWFPEANPFEGHATGIARSISAVGGVESIHDGYWVALVYNPVQVNTPQGLLRINPLGTHVQNPIVPTGLGITTIWRAAKVAPDQHLWLATDNGLYRSVTALPDP